MNEEGKNNRIKANINPKLNNKNHKIFQMKY